jgi:predicted nucleotidyltransferase
MSLEPKLLDLARSAPIIAEVESRYGCELLIYGSVATGVDRADSDLDILAIGLERGLDYKIATDLSTALERDVSVARKEDLYKLLAARIIGEARTVAQLLAGERPAPSRKSPLTYLRSIETAAQAIVRADTEFREMTMLTHARKIGHFSKRLRTLFGNCPIAFPGLPWASIRVLARFDDSFNPFHRKSRLRTAQARKAARHILRWRIKLDVETVLAHISGAEVEWSPKKKSK